MKPVIRLQGADADVRAVAREAVAILQEQGRRRGVLRRAPNAQQEQEAHGRRDANAAGDPAPVVPAPTARRAHRIAWGTLLTLGLVAALTAAAMLGPADRKNPFQSADLAVAVALPAVVVAIAAQLLVLVIRPSDGRSASTGETLAVLVGIPVAGILVFRLVAGVGDDRGFSAVTLAWWVPASAVVALLLIGIAVRCDGVRRSSDARAPWPWDPARDRRAGRVDVSCRVARMVLLRRGDRRLRGGPAPLTRTGPRRSTGPREREVDGHAGTSGSQSGIEENLERCGGKRTSGVEK